MTISRRTTIACISSVMILSVAAAFAADPLQSFKGHGSKRHGIRHGGYHGGHHGGHQSIASGMLLGVYAFPNHRGLRISNTIPGFSAEGRLFRDDVLLRATSAGMPVYSIRTHHEIEYAKEQIGPYREAAIEFWRPGAGLMYAWVEFRPINGGSQMYSAPGGLQRNAVPTQQKFKAEFKLESEKPGARRMFQGGASRPPQTLPQETRRPSFPSTLPNRGRVGGASDLFRSR
ncbi:MAG: hypothetical protein ACF8TS_14375 [Maioricimonas sp. JB049]